MLGIDNDHLYKCSLNTYADAMDFMQVIYFLFHVIFTQTASFTVIVTAERIAVLLEEHQSSVQRYRCSTDTFWWEPFFGFHLIRWLSAWVL